MFRIVFQKHPFLSGLIIKIKKSSLHFTDFSKKPDLRNVLLSIHVLLNINIKETIFLSTHAVFVRDSQTVATSIRT